jgi:large conductance mechanosensitive channel
MLKEFKEFAIQGNMVDMAVGIIIGAAFGVIVTSLVNDIIMPPIGMLLGGVDFNNLYILLQEGSPGAPYASLADAQAAGAVTINYGVFINALISFLVIAMAVFFLIRAMNRAMRPAEETPEEATSKECPFCYSTISVKASRCPNCTSQLG